MPTSIFVNLAVKDLKKSIHFFSKFRSFTPRALCDATKSTEVLLCLGVESREKVDELVRKAVAANGTAFKDPQDHGFMYAHGFQDLDGHIWELIHIVPRASG